MQVPKTDMTCACAFTDAIDMVGRTPVVRINNLNPNPNVQMWAKLEGYNPMGAVKDRIAKYMIEGAEARGELTKEKIIMEPTSGNTGIGLAFVAALKGYKITIVMPDSMSIERRQILAAFGAEMVLTPGKLGMNGAIEKAEEMRSDPRYYMPHQFENPDNVRAHYEGTAVEILDQVGHVDAFVAGMGTGGTLMGCSRRLRQDNAKVTIVGVEPYLGKPIQGLKSMDEGYIPPIFDLETLDEKVNYTPEEACEAARQLARRESLFVGMSAGAALAAAIEQAKQMDSGTLVVIFPDRGEKYLSTPVFKCEECVDRPCEQ